MRLEQLQYFLEAAKTGSFTQAATNLYVQQPTLRQGISSLEKELGCKLFIRSKRGVQLTAYGNDILLDIRQAVSLLENIRQKNTYQLKSEFKVEITYLFTLLYDSYMLASLYEEKSHIATKVKTSINDSLQTVLHNVATQKTDIGFITYTNREYPDILRYSKINLVELYKMPVGVRMSKKHPLSKRKTLSIKELQDYLVIFTGAPNPPLLNTVLHDVEHLDYIITNNFKMTSKYCTEDNGVCITTEQNKFISDKNWVYKKIKEDYCTIYAAAILKQENRSEIYEYISLMKILLQPSSSY